MASIRHHLDLRMASSLATSIVYDANLETTTFTFAAVPIMETIVASLATPTGDFPEAYLPEVLATTATTVTLRGDWHLADLYFGYTYLSYFQPTQIFYFGQDGRPVKAKRLTIRRIRADLASFGYIRVAVSVQARAIATTEYQGYATDDERTPLSLPAQEEIATITVPIGGNAPNVQIQFLNDTVVGFKFLGYEWEGNLFLKARRLT